MKSDRSIPALHALSLAGLVLGCTHPATQLVVVVDSDIPAAQLVEITTEVRPIDLPSSEPTVGEHSFVLRASGGPTTVSIPFSYGVVPVGGDPTRRVEIRVEARGAIDGAPLVVRRVRTGFLPEQSLRVPMFLSDACRGVDCSGMGPDLTCDRGMCVAVDVPPESLERVRPGEELGEAGLPDTGRADVGPSDAGGRDAPEPDAGVVIPAAVVPVGVDSFGDTAQVRALTIGVDGDLYVGGSTQMVTSFFGTAVSPGVVVARLSPSGTPRWVRNWTGDTASNFSWASAIQPTTSAVFVLGRVDESNGLTEVGGMGRVWSDDGVVGTDDFVAALDPTTGDVLDVLVVDGAGDESVSTFGGDGELLERGGVVYVETFAQSGRPPFDATTLAAGATASFSSSVTAGFPNQALLFSVPFAGGRFSAPTGRVTGRREAGAIAPTTTGIAGGFGLEWASGVDNQLEGLAPTAIHSAAGHYPLVAVVGLDTSLATTWVHRLSFDVAGSSSRLYGDLAAGGGLVWAVGAIGNDSDFCTSFAIEDATTPTSGTAGCAVLAAYGEDGSARGLPIAMERGSTNPTFLAVDGAGNVYEASSASGTASLGAGDPARTLSMYGSLFVASHTPSGAMRWAHVWPSDFSRLTAIRVSPLGEVWVAGDAYASVTFATGVRTSAGGFLLHLAAP